MIPFIWTKETYKEFQKEFYKFQDNEYKIFNDKIINTKLKTIGIRSPIMKDIAKQISKTDYKSFIKFNTHETYEEILLHGLVIGFIKAPFNEVLELMDNFIPFIDNWALCDTLCSNTKLFNKNLEAGFDYSQKCLNSNNPWEIRVGLVLLLSYYVNDDYIDKVFKLTNEVKNDHYYVRMANAWLISVCAIKYYDKTYKFLTNNKLDNWTHNKAIQKAIESFRISNDYKEKLRILKRK